MQKCLCLSTMEAEYVALSKSCKDLSPLIDLLQEFLEILDIQPLSLTHLHVQIHKDNVGALCLGEFEPCCMTPHSKHYAIKYHWF